MEVKEKMANTFFLKLTKYLEMVENDYFDYDQYK